MKCFEKEMAKVLANLFPPKNIDTKKCFFTTSFTGSIRCSLDGKFDELGLEETMCPNYPCAKIIELLDQPKVSFKSIPLTAKVVVLLLSISLAGCGDPNYTDQTPTDLKQHYGVTVPFQNHSGDIQARG